MAGEQVAGTVESGKGSEKGKVRRGKVVTRSTGECAAQRDALLDRMNETREVLDCVQCILEIYPATREGVETGGKKLAAILVDQGFSVNKFIKQLMAETEAA